MCIHTILKLAIVFNQYIPANPIYTRTTDRLEPHLNNPKLPKIYLVVQLTMFLILG